ncbi:hypothetical protein PAMP_004243 [Pampus punctatissimus]
MPRITDTTKHSISMTWTRPMYDGGSDVTGYVVEILEEGTEQWYRATTKALKTNEYVAAGLTANRKYRFRVAAINSNGTGDFSEPSAELEPLERVEIPDLELADDLKKTVCLRAGGTLRLFVSITGRPTPVVAWRKTGVELQRRGFIETTDSYTLLMVEKVGRYDSGKYVVEAENPSGKKTATILVKVYDTPGPPGSVNVKDYTKESVVITWDVPSIDGGAHISNYIIEKREASMKSYKTVTTECRKTLFRITGLTEGVHYFFRVLPENIYGVGEPCETSEALLVCEMPSVPLNLQVVDVTRSSVTLHWEKPLHDGGSRLTGYVIEACKVGSDRWSAVATAKASVSQHTIQSLAENDQYLFRIRATNSRGASEPMDTVTPVTIQDIKVMPKIDITSIPQKIVHVHRGKPIDLNIPIKAKPQPICSWFFGGIKLKDSLDRIKIDSNSKYTHLAIRETTINDTGDYTLEVKNANGMATEVIKVIILDKPGIPVGPMKIEEVDGVSVTTSWEPPEKDGGANITSYVVEQRDAHRPGWTTISESVTRPCFKFTRLSEGTEYVFRVAAMNRFGIGGFLQSDVVECKSAKTIPGCPSRPEVLDITHEGMTLTWHPPEDNGGSTIAGYIIERKEARSDRWMKINKNPVTMTRYRSSGLIEGLEYEYRITAINSRGAGKPSESSAITVAMDPIEPPGLPVQPRVTDTSRTSVSLAWLPPEEEGGAIITGYLIEMQKVDQVEWTLCNTTPTKMCEYTLTHMPQGAEYKFRVIACNAGGAGEPAEIPGVVKVQEMLDYPDYELDRKYEEGYVVRQGGVICLSVRITGKPIPTCKWTKDGHDISHRAMIATNDDITELVIKEAHKDDTGTYDLVLENKCGRKAVYIKVKVNGRPDAPEGPLEFDDIQARSVRVSWRPPSDDGGSDVLGYILERREVPKSAWYTVDARVTENSLVVKGLKEHVEYHFRVFAENQFGVSRSLKSEDSVTPKTPLCPPEPPSNPPDIMDVAKSSVSLSWARPRDDGGSRVTGYYVERREVSTEKWVRHNKTHITTTMYNVTGLIPDAEYMFRVVAQNDIGQSEPGPASESVVCKDPFDKPSQPGEIDIISITKDCITIHWLRPEHDGGKEILGYWIEFRQAGESSWKKCNKERSKDRQFTMGGLMEATEYEFRIFAENEAGLSRPRRTPMGIKTKLSVGEAPVLKEDIQDVTTKLGESGTMTCGIIGRPLPEIKWYRYGKELIQSRKYKMSSDGRNHSLSILTDEQEDEGLYTCRAINEAGEIETSGKLRLQAAPQFHPGYPLKEKYFAGAGTSLRLHVIYIGRPIPQIMWFYGKKPLNPSENVIIENTESYTHLVVRNVQRKTNAGRYKVQLSNSFGTIDTVLRVEIQDKPCIPEGPVVVEALLKSSVVISWKAPKDDGGSIITNYIVEKRMAKEGELWHLVSSSVSGTTCRVPNLIENAGYYFRVSAQNQYGVSEPLEIPAVVIIKSPFEKPGIPQQLLIISSTKDSCVVSWKPPSSDGGAKITSYYLEKREKKQNKWMSVTSKKIVETSYEVSGLIEGFEYEFRVKCENMGGESNWSEISEPVIPKSDQLPRAPVFREEIRDMTVKYHANATFVTKVVGHPKPVVKWYRSGKEILADGTKIKAQEFKGGYYQLVIISADESDATVYQFRATNSEGSISATANLEVEVPAKIHLPKELQGMGAVQAVRGDHITIKIPISGKPEPAITWQKGQEILSNTSYHQVITTRSFTSLVFQKGVQRRDTGFYIITAKNRFGMDKQTIEVNVADIPEAPKGLMVSDIARDSITLTWKPPANDGGSDIIGYIVEKCPTSADRWIRAGQTVECSMTIINIFGKTKYQFRVIAENQFGLSPPCEPTEPITTKEDKSVIRNYDEEVDEAREITKEEALFYKVKELSSKYIVSEELARCQFGVVHRCVEIATKKTFMAKFIKVKGTDRELVLREIEALNVARHKNIIYLHEYFESMEEIILIFEFISGVDIFERLGTSTFELTEQEIVSYLRQVCSSLKFLHSHNFGHFDIRPDNIVYTTRRSSVIKIIEMGQARLLVPGENIRMVLSALEYCAPEIHRHDLVTTATDMWSVGVMAYVLLSGINPFAAESTTQMIENISNCEYVFDNEAFNDISLEAMDFVDRLLVKDKRIRMTAHEALEHPWLKMKIEHVSNKVIRTLRHRRYYQTLVKRTETILSAARVAYGGAFKNQRGLAVGKVKIGTEYRGLRAGPIMHSSAEEGGHVRFTCSLTNYDKSTQVSWYFGNRQLHQSAKYEITYSNGFSSIYVKDIEDSDDGVYRCKVVSDDGEASAYGELFVETVRSIREHFVSRSIKKLRKRVDKTKLLQRPPEFTLPLYNRTAYIGEDVRFGVTITVHPEPHVTWLKNGEKIKPGDDDSKYTFISDKGLYQLMIHNLDMSDDAEYTIMAHNKFGEDSCKAHLTVTTHPVVEETIRPMFKRLLANAECVEGHSLRFELRVSGIPTPTLKWEKDGHPLQFGPKVVVIEEDVDYHVLHIRETLLEDSGVYKVTATNSAGSASCQATLKVNRLTYTRREYKSEEEKYRHIQKQIEKTNKMAQQIVATEDLVPLNPTAQEALKFAAEMYKPAVSTKNVEGEFDITVEKSETKKLEEERRIFMPYEIPEPVVHDPRDLDEDKAIKQFVPLSDMKWYRKLRDQYEIPERMERIVQKRQRRIRLSRWEQFYVMPLPRITDQYRPRWRIPKLTLDDLETVRPARRSPSPESEASFRSRRRSLGDLSDEELLMPMDDYISMRRSEEEKIMLEDELELGFSASPAGSPVRIVQRAQEHEERRQEVRHEAAEVAETKKKRTISQFMRRRRSLSPTYIELMRPVSELIRPPRARPPVEVEGEIVERRSPTPERTRPRSPSPIRSVERSSRSSSRFERSARFDIMSRYEARKAALKSERKYQVVSQTPFSLDHAPRVTVRMRSHRIPIGQDTKFTLNIQAKPEAEVKWFHNATAISESSEKYVFTNMSGVLSITILDCQEEDSGTYRCVVSNSKGEASDYATLDVSGSGYTTFSSRRRDEDTLKAYVPEVTRIDHYHTTHFKAGYASQTHFEVEESKSKLTEIREVVTRERYAASSERYSSAERYDSSVKYASAEYLSSGSSYSSDKFSLTGKHTTSEAKLKSSFAAVTEDVSVHKVKATLEARFLTKPQSLTIAEGETARFSCDIDGEPAPTVTWLNESGTIVSSYRVQVTTTQYKSNLEISSVTTSDEGSYTVVIENSAGRQEAYFTLTIRKSPPKEEVKAVKSAEPSVKLPTPSAKLPEPSVTSPATSVTSPVPSAQSPEPRIKSHEPSIKSPTPSVKSPEPSVTSPTPSIKSPMQRVKSPTPNVKSPEPEGIKSPRSIRSPEPSAPSPAHSVKSPTPSIKSPEPEGVKSPKGIKSPEPRLKSPPPIKAPERGKSPEPEGVKSPRGVRSPEPAGIKTPRGLKSPEPVGIKTPKGIKSPEPSGIKSPLRMKSPPPIMSPKRVVSPPTVKSPIPKPPKVLSLLTAEACGGSVRMSCVCESSVREVVWYVNGRRISQSSRFVMQYAEGSCSLLISDLTDSDKGEYTCEMTSEGGVSKSSFSFTGQVFQSILMKVATYREQQMALKGSMMMSHKESSSSMSSSTMMKKEIHTMEESSSFSSSSSAQQAMMSSIMESSSFSSMAAEMKFETMSMSSMSSMASEAYAMSSSSLTEMATQMEGSSFRAIGSAPRIEALPEDISIELGKVLTVACAFSGEAKNIEWSHDGKTIEVTAGGRFHIETTGDLTTLIITGVKVKDAGTYTLKLSNELGSDTATVHISIRSVRKFHLERIPCQTEKLNSVPQQYVEVYKIASTGPLTRALFTSTINLANHESSLCLFAEAELSLGGGGVVLDCSGTTTPPLRPP